MLLFFLTGCGGGNVKILLMSSGKCVGSDTMMDQGPWCKCNCLVENQLVPIMQLWEIMGVPIGYCSIIVNCDQKICCIFSVA